MADGLYNTPLSEFIEAGFTAINGAYVSLHRIEPTDGSNELSGSGYTRQAVTLAATGAGCMYNSAAVLFGPFTATSTVQYYGLWTTGPAAGGSCLGHWQIKNSSGTGIGTTAVAIAAGVYFAVGDLHFTLTNS